MNSHKLNFLIVVFLFSTLCCRDSQNKKPIEEWQVVAILESNHLSENINEVELDTFKKAHRINIFLNYEYPHAAWSQIVTGDVAVDFENSGLADGFLKNDKGNYYISLWYQMKDGEARYEVGVPSEVKRYYQLPKYGQFTSYVMSNISPSDFQYYDTCFNLLYEDTGDPIYDRPFFDFYLGLCEDENLDLSEEKVLNRLIEMSRTNPKILKSDHFEYFKNHLSREFESIDIEDS